jgi:hypothetical protein
MQKGRNSVNELVKEPRVHSTIWFLKKLKKIFEMTPFICSNILTNQRLNSNVDKLSRGLRTISLVISSAFLQVALIFFSAIFFAMLLPPGKWIFRTRHFFFLLLDHFPVQLI